MNTDREHLDAETVAAWMDGALKGASLAAAEAHASNCERCQALLATITKTLPPQERAHATTRLAWWKWLAPLAATAAAVTLWMVVPQDPMQPPAASEPAADVPTAPTTPQASVPSAPAPPAAAVETPQQASSSSAPAGSARFAEGRRGASAEAGAKRADAQTNTADAAVFRDRLEKREKVVEEARAAASPPPPAPPAMAAPPEPARETAAPGATLGAAAQLRKQGPVEISSPDTQHRWRVLPDIVEHSLDGGRTWIPVRLNAGDAITAGASPAAQVCWFVGRAGLVLLATDGTNFTRLPFPERVDLTAITAADARRATVTTVDGRTFRTDDNGRNWRNP